MTAAARRRRLGAGGGFLLGALAVAARADDLHRVHVSKDAGAAPVVESRPLQGSNNGNGGSGGGDGGVVAGVLQGLFRSDGDSGGTARERAPYDGPRNRGLGLQGGPAAIWIFTTLHTAFNTPSAPNVQWSDKLALAGGGWHGSLIFESDDDGRATVGLEGGYFKDSRWRHVQSGANGVFASERLDVDGAWAALWARAYPSEWAFVSGTLGLGGYSVNTRVDTNAPIYAYDGLAGSRAIALGGIGAGLTTPVRCRFGASVEGRWFFSGAGDSRIESGGAIVSADLKARF